ncbi:MAG: hypothetical protein PVH21_03635 [Myxococcales bacterium]|jgi:hypothetical protein
MSRLSEGKFGPSGKTLSELTNRELMDERAKRRRRQDADEERPGWRRVRQYLANLELGAGATWPEIERAYARLLDRYRPEKHAEDPARHRAAQELTESLTRAYQTLQRYFDRSGQ